MTAAALKPRVDTLEEAMRELALQSVRTQKELQLLSREMRGFKDEVSEFKDEMGEFKEEMKDFKDETRREHRKLNRTWGEMANRLGFVVLAIGDELMEVQNPPGFTPTPW